MRWTTRTLRIQTLTKETGTLRDRGSSTGPDLTLPPALRSPNGTGRDSEAPTLPPAPGSLDVQPGREFSPGTPGRSSLPPPNSGASTSIDWQRDHDVSPTSFTAPAGRKPRAEDRLDPDVNAERIVLNPSLTGALTRKINLHRRTKRGDRTARRRGQKSARPWGSVDRGGRSGA